MEYIKHEIQSYNLHIIKTKKFKSINIDINFKRQFNGEEISIRNALGRMLVESSKKYPSKRLLDIKSQDLYGLKYGMSYSMSGNYDILSFSTRFLNESYTEEGMLEKSIGFLTDIILDPDIENNLFNEQKLQLVKKRMIENIERNLTKPHAYSMERLNQEMGKKEPFSYNAHGNIGYLEALTNELLYEYYKSFIKSDTIDVFIIGDVDEEKIIQIFSEKLTINTLKKKTGSHIYEHPKFRKRAKVIKEDFDSNQSQLLIGCKLSNLTEFERKYVALAYSFILGSGSDSRLFKVVREKHSLCYSINSSISTVYNTIKITAGIDKENHNKALRLIRKEMNNIAKGDITEEEIEQVKTTYLNALEEMKDSAGSILNNHISQEYLGTDNFEERSINIHKVTKKMIVDFAKKVHIDTIFLLEGNDDIEETSI